MQKKKQKKFIQRAMVPRSGVLTENFIWVFTINYSTQLFRRNIKIVQYMIASNENRMDLAEKQQVYL